MRPFRFFDAGDGGGEGASDSADDKTTDAGDAGGEGDAGTKTDDSNDGEAGKEDFEAMFKTEQEKSADLSSKNEHLTKKLGKQSDKAGAFNRLAEARKNDPRGLAESILKDAGIKFDIESGTDAVDLSGILNDEAAEGKITEAIAMAEKRGAETVRAELAPELNRVFEHQLREKYPDFDELSESREVLEQSLLTKQITYKEVLHFAAQGMNLNKALEAAEQQGIEKYKKMLADKAAGTLDTGADDGSEGKKKQHDPKDNKYFDDVIDNMSKIV